MGIIAPSLVQIGNVAPVRPSAVFYPTTPAPLSSADLLRDFGLRAPSVMRSLGSVEAAAVTLRQKVAIEKKEDLDTSAGSEPNVGIDYRYSLSGVDLGISGGSDLGLVVEGHCMTEYGWVIDHTKDENSTDPYDDYHLDLYDEYRPWEDPNSSISVLLNTFDTAHAPLATFLNHPNAEAQLEAGDFVLYVVVIHSAWRSSITAGSDPWYVNPCSLPLDSSRTLQFSFRHAAQGKGPSS